MVRAGTRRFVYAPDGRVLGEYGSSASDVKAEFIWMSPEVGEGGTFGGDDALGGYMPLSVAVPTVTEPDRLLWVHGNHMGVPTVITDATGTEHSFPTGYALPGFPGQNRTFADLYYNRYRDYDPTTGRYIQADPIGLEGGASPYSYAMNNPLRYADPTGEIVPLVILGGMALGGGLELALQAGENYLDGCEVFNFNWWDVGVSTFVGGVSPGLVSLGGRGWKTYKRYKQYKKYLKKTKNIQNRARFKRNLSKNKQDYVDYIYLYGFWQVFKYGGKA